MTSARNAVDPGNAILNYAYAVALGNSTRALIALGLDPTFGFLHADKSGRLSLSYDVIEVLRPTGLCFNGLEAGHSSEKISSNCQAVQPC